LQCIKAGASWEEFLSRASGRFYKDQVRIAADKYLEKYGRIENSVPGMNRWLEENKGAD